MASTTKWIEDTKQFSKKNNKSYKDSLKDNENAAIYYSKKFEGKNESLVMKDIHQEMCADLYSLNAVNKNNTKGGTEHYLIDKQIKNIRENIKNVSNDNPSVLKTKSPKPVKAKAPKEPKPVKAKAPKEPKPVKAKAPKEPKPVKAKAPKEPKQSKVSKAKN
jgi:cell division protein FtsN